MESTLTLLAARKTPLEHKLLSRDSIRWLQDQTRKLSNNPMKYAKEISRESNSRQGKFRVGGLFHFFYDPIGKEKLDYYDSFPLVIPLKIVNDGFLGLNLHYLPVRMRAFFLDKLLVSAFVNGNEISRVRISYDILNTMNNYQEFRPCIKHYMFTRLRSDILAINPNEWEVALFLPTQMFRKASATTVYSESIRKTQRKET